MENPLRDNDAVSAVVGVEVPGEWEDELATDWRVRVVRTRAASDMENWRERDGGSGG